ncbi:MAG: hypothetical protein AABW59_00170 [archaeon]
MPKTIPKRKQDQIRQFFRQHVKAVRLERMAKARGNVIGLSSRGWPAVLRVNIAGKKRAVKYSPEVAGIERYALEKLLSEHKKALSKGIIHAKSYSLTKSPYLFSTPDVGVMREIMGVGLDNLFRHMEHPSEQNVKEREFLLKNPKIKYEQLHTAWGELYTNLSLMKAKKFIPSFDMVGNNNVIVVGFDAKKKKPVLALIDQQHPDEYLKTRMFKSVDDHNKRSR